jgi:outer membrane murein-binding lipoprotein Lpp
MMRIVTLVVTSALIAGGFVAMDGGSSTAAMDAPAGTVVNRSAKSDRLVKMSRGDMAAQNVSIEVDHGRGMTTVIRKAPTPVATTGETDFAFLAN